MPSLFNMEAAYNNGLADGVEEGRPLAEAIRAWSRVRGPDFSCDPSYTRLVTSLAEWDKRNPDPKASK